MSGMFRATMNRNQYRAQLYMRGRCAAQLFTVCALVGGAIYVGWDPTKLGKKQTKPFTSGEEQNFSG
ncbi:hypothetical protein L596_022157 [Steinernema carpocapsae]|uniref:HIG1 domain-containing protein n=1 Tax=Steinernema carpocapsae TaxID=34508 RepID=A0A4U5MKV3_STECR|nr:hypothetical protein L596_022157 [Steinernema carpocapsae]